jgi:LPXTG-motif cell wall-anchored protein
MCGRRRERGKGMRKVTARVLTLALVVVAAMVVPMTAALATHVDPVFIDGNVQEGVCAENFPGTTELFLGSKAPNGSLDGVTILNSDGKTFDFETSGGTLVVAVYVKGGENTNLYDYSGFPDGGETSDTGLHAPEVGQGNIPDVSHGFFCVIPGEETTTTTTLGQGPGAPVTGFNPLPFVGLGLVLLAGGAFVLRRRIV